ncbi:MarR family winged helix-turn-helix transcriptional regulator [Microbulbifer marinus]|uniref:DNA-binding transcriptional regulator, MarR family n=1 Tax=Microbulbifer marinus TaxID=658218 RepID=A0A1H4APS9_9GAMM|nr:MarR family transcriptional regulator [Microbulbifer marinus]SEA37905.1 DNA-binding transcriptional regulator, MarR family [Microbulbifer marinus]
MTICDHDNGALALNRQLCFALYAASRAMTRAYQPMLQDLGITYPQYLVLLVLWEWDQPGERDDTDFSVGALGGRLMLDSGTLTPLLKRMEQRGLVIRRRAARDERVTLVEITDAGRALKPRAQDWVTRQLDDSPVSPQEVEQLRGQLWTFLAKLGGGAPVSGSSVDD